MLSQLLLEPARILGMIVWKTKWVKGGNCNGEHRLAQLGRIGL